jgi:serine protease Do
MKKRILSLIVSLSLVIGCVFSLSSCEMVKSILRSIIPEELLDDGEAAGEGDGTDTEGSGEGAGDGSGSAGGTSSGGDTGDGNPSDDTEPETPDADDEVVFIPGGSDGEAADSLTSAQRALLSTVIVRPTFEVNNGYTTRTEISNGAGVIYSLDRESGDAIIITNYHVVYYKESLTSDKISDDINIYLYGMEYEQYKIKASFIGGSLTEDIAVLRVEGSEVLKNSSATSVVIGDSSLASVTDRVLAVGNPEGDGISASEGMISVNDENISMLGADGRTMISIRVIRVDCGINQGNSGGGLYDADGKLIGIVNAKKTGSDIDNIGWALPINRVRNLVDNILDHCDGDTQRKAKKAVVGITLQVVAMGVRIDESTGDVRRYELVDVQKLEDTCIIADSIRVGDVIRYTVVDGVRLDADRMHMVVDHLLRARVGSTLVIGAERDGVAFEITVTLPEECFVVIN